MWDMSEWFLNRNPFGSKNNFNVSKSMVGMKIVYCFYQGFDIVEPCCIPCRRGSSGTETSWGNLPSTLSILSNFD